MEITYCDLRSKEVVNVCDGKRLGRIVDMVFAYPTGTVLGIVVPGVKNGLFRPCADLFIDFRSIDRIGDDVILVNLHAAQPKPQPRVPGREEHYDAEEDE